jgi:hypothetical protein
MSSKTKVYLEDVVTFFNGIAAEAYERDGDISTFGWAYSAAANRLYAADMQGEFEPVALR